MNNTNEIMMKITVSADVLPDLYQSLVALSGRKRQLLLFKYLSTGELVIHGSIAPRHSGALPSDMPTIANGTEDDDYNGELAKSLLEFSDSFTKKH